MYQIFLKIVINRLVKNYSHSIERSRVKSLRYLPIEKICWFYWIAYLQNHTMENLM